MQFTKRLHGLARRVEGAIGEGKQFVRCRLLRSRQRSLQCLLDRRYGEFKIEVVIGGLCRLQRRVGLRLCRRRDDQADAYPCERTHHRSCCRVNG